MELYQVNQYDLEWNVVNLERRVLQEGNPHVKRRLVYWVKDSESYRCQPDHEDVEPNKSSGSEKSEIEQKNQEKIKKYRSFRPLLTNIDHLPTLVSNVIVVSLFWKFSQIALIMPILDIGLR